MGITPYVYGISGRQWNDVPRQAEQLMKEHGEEVDAIIVLMGTNDFNAGIPIGEWFTETEEQVLAARGEMKKMETRKKRTPVMDSNTYKGRINIGITRMKQLFPDKQIILLTPLHRAFANFGETNVQPDENYQNSCGEYVDAYVQAVPEGFSQRKIPHHGKTLRADKYSGTSCMVCPPAILHVQPDENYQNSCGEYVDAYVQAVKEAGNLWGLPVIDFNSVTGMKPYAGGAIRLKVPLFRRLRLVRPHHEESPHIAQYAPDNHRLS